MNLSLYYYNGYGFFPFKFAATYMFVMAQCLLSLVFVGLAFGMGLKHARITKMLENNTWFNSNEGNLPIVFAITLVILCHAVIAVSIFYDHEEDHKYHDY